MNLKLKAIEDGIHEVLSPLGFKKQKRSWYRTKSDMVQAFGLEKMTVANAYQFRYGASLFKFSENPKPPIAGLHLQWTIEEHIPTVEARQNLWNALHLENDLTDSERVKIIQFAIKEYVLTALEATDTLEKLRDVLTPKKNPSPFIFGSYHTFAPEDI